MRSTVLALLVVLLAGCAAGNKFAYDQARTSLPYAGKAAVAVTVADRRPYVVNRDKSPDYVGLMRMRVGVPFPVHTASGKPLAEDVKVALTQTLRSAGFPVAGGGRTVNLVIREWRTDTLNDTALYYDLVMTVNSPKGQVLGQKRVNGRDDLGGKFLGRIAKAHDTAPNALSMKLRLLLTSPEIAKALA